MNALKILAYQLRYVESFIDYSKSFIPDSDKGQYFMVSKDFNWVRDQLQFIKSNSHSPTIILSGYSGSLQSLAEHEFYEDKTRIIRIEENLQDKVRFINSYIISSEQLYNPHYKEILKYERGGKFLYYIYKSVN